MDNFEKAKGILSMAQTIIDKQSMIYSYIGYINRSIILLDGDGIKHEFRRVEIKGGKLYLDGMLFVMRDNEWYRKELRENWGKMKGSDLLSMLLEKLEPEFLYNVLDEVERYLECGKYV